MNHDNAVASGRGRIDVHAHFLPDFYSAAAAAAGHSQPDGMPRLPAWSAEDHLRFMDRAGVETAILSISSPGVHFGNDQAAIELARRVNETGAEISAAYPGRFGFFASALLPDVDHSVAEVSYAIDELGAVGVVLFSNTDGMYLGDPRMDPLIAAVAARKSTIFIHPTTPVCGEALTLGRPAPILEFPLDTTRAVTNLVLSGVLDRHPGATVVLPHAGGALSSIADRVAEISSRLLPPPASDVDFLGTVQSFYYDIAGFPFPRQILSVLGLVGPDKLLFGTDWPYTVEPTVLSQVTAYEQSEILDAEAHRLLDRNTAEVLFPQFAHKN